MKRKEMRELESFLILLKAQLPLSEEVVHAEQEDDWEYEDGPTWTKSKASTFMIKDKTAISQGEMVDVVSS